ncbi:MAG: KpsF/GutQ family sugar-phosphate isomerase [SAR324 cluster bacterium]|nr:KpsF/GutQ family sugar-phosphate isomerase [SAR324 cluster bacterium]
MEVLNSINEVIELEIKALEDLKAVVDSSFEKAVEMILATKGKVVVTGMGKSGHIGAKIAATMSSTGTTAVFLHPSEALHGDLGLVEKEDILLMLSKSGESDEMIALIPSLKKIGCSYIAITANLESTLAQNADLALFTPIEKEACALNLAPTCSTTSSLVLGDALAVTLMKAKDFTPQDFALYHPAGRLGKRLLYLVDTLMHKGDENPIVSADTAFDDLLVAMSEGGVNGVCVVDSSQNFLGLITGYDIRKAFGGNSDLKSLKAKEMMNPSGLCIASGTYAIECLTQMRDSKKPLNLMPVLDGKRVIGVITLQDLVRAGL